MKSLCPSLSVKPQPGEIAWPAVVMVVVVMVTNIPGPAAIFHQSWHIILQHFLKYVQAVKPSIHIDRQSDKLFRCFYWLFRCKRTSSRHQLWSNISKCFDFYWNITLDFNLKILQIETEEALELQSIRIDSVECHPHLRSNSCHDLVTAFLPAAGQS